MHTSESSLAAQQEVAQLHAATCLLMTRFINGHHCPKLAHDIVQQLQRLLTHPSLEQVPVSLDMYRQLLEHWQGVSRTLLEQKTARQHSIIYH